MKSLVGTDPVCFHSSTYLIFQIVCPAGRRRSGYSERRPRRVVYYSPPRGGRRMPEEYSGQEVRRRARRRRRWAPLLVLVLLLMRAPALLALLLRRAPRPEEEPQPGLRREPPGLKPILTSLCVGVWSVSISSTRLIGNYHKQTRTTVSQECKHFYLWKEKKRKKGEEKKKKKKPPGHSPTILGLEAEHEL